MKNSVRLYSKNKKYLGFLKIFIIVLQREIRYSGNVGCNGMKSKIAGIRKKEAYKK